MCVYCGSLWICVCVRSIESARDHDHDFGVGVMRHRDENYVQAERPTLSETWLDDAGWSNAMLDSVWRWQAMLDDVRWAMIVELMGCFESRLWKSIRWWNLHSTGGRNCVLELRSLNKAMWFSMKICRLQSVLEIWCDAPSWSKARCSETEQLATSIRIYSKLYNYIF